MVKIFSRIFLAAMFIAFLSIIAHAEEPFLIEVDGKRNCCMHNDFKKCSVELQLKPGKYVATPVKGAISRWRDNGTAKRQGERPWEWYVNIEVAGDFHGLGSQVRYDKEEDALVSQREEKVIFEIKKMTFVRLWVEDEWEGRNYCSDNRGKLLMRIDKVE